MKKKEIKDTKKTKEIKFETKQLKNTTVDHDNSAVVTFIVALIVIAVLGVATATVLVIRRRSRLI